MNILKENKGQVSLIITLIVMSILFFISLFLANISAKETVVTLNTEKSKKSFYAAESGIERVLYAIYVEDIGVQAGYVMPSLPATVVTYGNSNEYSFNVEALTDTRIKSIGGYGNIKRAIEINY